MQLTEEQLRTIDITVNKYKNKNKYVVISGWAGCGKSTIIKYIIQALPDVNPDTDVIYSAFTGKACEVMKRKGNSNVSTLHKLLYQTRLLPNGNYQRTKKTSLEYKVVIVDECSMLPKDMLSILLDLSPFTIFLGDDAQLPPIKKEDDNGLLLNPDIRLTKVLRQAEGNDILDVATAIREGKKIKNFQGKNAMILPKEELTDGMLEWADIVICGTNKSRKFLNQIIRKTKGFEKKIEEGEKVICLKNNWDIFGDNESPLINGSIGYVKNIEERTLHNLKSLGGDFPIYNFDFITEVNENFNHLNADKQMFLTEVPFVDNKVKYWMKKAHVYIPEDFTYGYCITCHKAQGSQWDKVLIYEEGFPFDREEHKRWLYTAVTRAAEKLVIVH